jgi:uncharacterized protein (UPF0248 family)
MENGFILVEKEQIADFHFPHEGIVLSESEKATLKITLERAISLGNIEHQKVRIYFEDDIAKKVVETTIWAVTDEAIVLKQNVVIPTHRIIKLEI